MYDGIKKYNEHVERIRILEGGGRIKCPNCEDGYIIKIDDEIYMCKKCKVGIVSRFKLDLPA